MKVLRHSIIQVSFFVAVILLFFARASAADKLIATSARNQRQSKLRRLQAG